MAKILVVDDDFDCRCFTMEMLALAGHEAHGAENGKEALEHLEHCPHAIILLDLMMPVMDGREFLLCRFKKPELLRVPVVVVSGSLGCDYFRRLKLTDRDGYLPKPVCPDKLLSEVEARVGAWTS